VIAGLLAGALDIVAAIAFWGLRGVSATRILQSVASGLLGRDAFSGGASTAVLGLSLHFSIATTAAAVYYLFSRRLAVLVRRWVLSGVSYGVAVYAFMHFIVLPLSAVTKRPFDLGVAMSMVLIHIVCVGLPISSTVRYHSRPTPC
jgi:uncharacterized membrane protein YagU involved in acid resistance